MTLTPEQKTAGWIEWNGGECPIKDDRTRVEVLIDGRGPCRAKAPRDWNWKHHGRGSDIRAYRIIEAHGADAEPARPTPWPASYDDLVFDADGWSQTIIVDGKRPEWLRDEDRCSIYRHASGNLAKHTEWEIPQSIRVRRREPKRETVMCWVKPFLHGDTFKSFTATIDLIDGKPDDTTLKIEGAA